MSIHVVCLFLLLCIHFRLSYAIPAALTYPEPNTKFSLSKVKSAYFSEKKPFNPSLIGPVRDIVAKPNELSAYIHPRVGMGKKEWNDLISRHANPATFNQPNTWSHSFLRLSRGNGPDSPFVKRIADLETSRRTAVFTGQHRTDFSNDAKYDEYRRSLKPLANYIKESTELHSHSLFLCAFWATVSEKQGPNHFLESDVMKKCIDASVGWAKVLMAHRTYHCNPVCKTETPDAELSFVWNYELFWAVRNDWHTIGSSLALAYDVMYERLSKDQRETIRSALALLVLKRFSWGIADENSVRNPDAETHPHRIFSNWATYHSNIYLTNLAIEGEKGFVSYAAKVLADNDSEGFDKKLDRKWDALYKAYWEHSIYPDGSSYEDGYTFHTALREGGLGLVANHRRGKNNHLNTARFRNMIHNVAQQWEPWQCGLLVGHASGGGESYNTYVGLIRYAYPNGILPRMVWAQRFGKDFLNTEECRIWWTQTMTQLAFFGDEHADPKEKIADSPESLPPVAKSSFSLSYVATRRGLIIARGSHSQNTSYLHFDARTDSIFLGHDNADRGIITFAALKTRWLDDLPWRDNIESRKHSLLHIDGLSQAVKAPPATILKAIDSQAHFIASADLSYSYNVQWAPAWQGPNVGTGTMKEYASNGRWQMKTYTFTDREPNSPWDLGWLIEDKAADIGFYPGMNLNPLPDIGFAGTNEWRRLYRPRSLSYYVRSTILVRSKKNDVGFAVLVDSVDAGAGKHDFDSYLMLHNEASLDTSSTCSANKCLITLKSSGNARLDLHAESKNKLSFRVETIEGNHRRLILSSTGIAKEEIWIAMHPHMGDTNGFQMKRVSEGMQFFYEQEEQMFRVDDSDHTVVSKTGTATVASPTPSKSRLPPRASRSPIPASVTPSKSPQAVPSRNPSPVVASATPTPSTPTRDQGRKIPLPEEFFPHPRPTTFSRRPMKAISLNHNQWREIPYEQIRKHDAESYFDWTDADYQFVVKIESHTTPKRGDRFSTCRGYTNTETVMRLYECESEDEYFKRNCEQVADSNENDYCNDANGQYKTDMKRRLSAEKSYYLVVDVQKRISLEPRVAIGHRNYWTG